jgi:signal transduction histidine kinase/CheY-like chemotaxis protein
MERSVTSRSGIARVEASFRPPPERGAPASDDREAGRAFLASPNHEQSLDRVTDLARVALGAQSAVLSCVREGGEYFKSMAGLPQSLAERRSVPLIESLCRAALLEGRSTAVESGLGRTSAIAQAFGWAACLAVPVHGRARPLGALWVVSDFDRRWTDRDHELLARFAAHAAEIAIAAEAREHVHAEARDRLARFVALAGSIPDGLWCVAFEDPIATSLPAATQVERMFEHGRLVECNDVLARLLGAGFAEDLLALPLGELIDRTSGGVQMALVDFVSNGYRLESLTTPVPHGRAAERREIANLAGVLDDGRLTRLWGVVRADVTRVTPTVGPPPSLDAIARLAGGVAHEFNNLLTTIRGHTELALRDRQDDADLAEIRRATDRAKALTRQLLAFSRKPSARPRVVDPRTLVADLETVLHHLLGESRPLTVRRSPGTGLVRADLAQVERALIQLVSFIRDATPVAGQVLIDIAETERTTPAGPAAPAVGIRVSHPALVLESDALASIAASPFGDLTLRGADGLVAAFALVRQNGGDILVESDARQGTSFLILFPRLADGSRETREPAETEGLLAEAETILVVEDEDAVRAVARRTLLIQGYTVMEAENAQVALDLAAGYPGRIHLLLTDVVMPGLSGPFLAERLRSERTDTRVLFMSGYSGDIIPPGVRARDGFLEKPFTPMSLARAVRQTLDRVEI